MNKKIICHRRGLEALSFGKKCFSFSEISYRRPILSDTFPFLSFDSCPLWPHSSPKMCLTSILLPHGALLPICWFCGRQVLARSQKQEKCNKTRNTEWRTARAVVQAAQRKSVPRTRTQAAVWNGNIPNLEVHGKIWDQIRVRARGTVITQSQKLGGQCQTEHWGRQCVQGVLRQKIRCVGTEGGGDETRALSRKRGPWSRAAFWLGHNTFLYFLPVQKQSELIGQST